MQHIFDSAKNVNYVIANCGRIHDWAARVFAEHFYNSVHAGDHVRDAYWYAVGCLLSSVGIQPLRPGMLTRELSVEDDFGVPKLHRLAPSPCDTQPAPARAVLAKVEDVDARTR